MAQLGFPHVASYDPFSMPVRPIGKFDVITCSEVIEHSPFPLRTLADMRSMLADEGCIVLSETLQPTRRREMAMSAPSRTGRSQSWLTSAG
jgi:2-polyprenyl-3-methyl-5-hydroxy-6-metoxy-1,4-benzoquinol methylase